LPIGAFSLGKSEFFWKSFSGIFHQHLYFSGIFTYPSKVF
jgi:hypothetical protein